MSFVASEDVRENSLSAEGVFEGGEPQNQHASDREIVPTVPLGVAVTLQPD